MTVIEELIHRAYLNKLVGEEGLRIVECIPGEEITDERLAELTGISLNTVRRTLYLLYEHRLAIYRRKRDPDSGWLTYLWQLCPENFDKALESEAKRLLRKLDERLTMRRIISSMPAPKAVPGSSSTRRARPISSVPSVREAWSTWRTPKSWRPSKSR